PVMSRSGLVLISISKPKSRHRSVPIDLLTCACFQTARLAEAGANSKNTCKLPRDSGSCSLSLTYYHFDSSTKTCEPFQYSGCKGNANRFHTKEDCMQVCGKTGGSEREEPEGRTTWIHRIIGSGVTSKRTERSLGVMGRPGSFMQ
uniref:BPTI/Kunitz inhibitor domain-containing protein n=1 Tax=Anolis carolinensis TaxID=28377 RepID=A0A803TLZ3_ANOCA